MSVTDEIKSRLDIVNFIQQYVPLKRAGHNYKACCPFHSEKTPSFVVNPDTQTWRCFGSCADGGDIFNFAQKYHGWSFPEALQELGRVAGIEVQQQSAEQKQQAARQDVLRGLTQAAVDYYHEQLWQTADVLHYVREKRGFNDETIQTYGIGYAPDGWQNGLNALTQLAYSEDDLVEVGLARRNEAGRVYDYFRNRLMIPIRDERGRVIGYGARALDPDDNPKYLNSPQTLLFDKSRTLFGLDRAKRAIRESETAVIVEGYMDVIQAHQAGFLNVVAQMGTAMTEMQLKLLAPRLAKKIILALDADAAGQNATMRSLEVARAALRADYTGKLAVDLRVLHIPGAKDPDDLIRETPDEWPRLVDGAIPVADYVIDVEVGQLPEGPERATYHERMAVAEKLIPILAATENEKYAEYNGQKLALALHLPEKIILDQLKELRRIERASPPRRFRDEPPPDYPQQQYDDHDTPPDDEVRYAPVAPRSVPKQRSPHDTSRLEAHCLSGLLKQPDLIYQINRKFRELASANIVMLEGPLVDFGIDDFNQSEYRALLEIVLASLQQDEIAPIDYLKSNLDQVLAQILYEHKLTTKMDEFVGFYVRDRFPGDRPDIIRKLRKPLEADLDSETIRNALYLRVVRLKKERDEFRLLLQNEIKDLKELLSRNRESNGALIVKAIQLIDSELQQQTRQVY